MLEVVLEAARLEVGVELLGGQITQVLGVLGLVVTPDTPRQLVLGDVSRDILGGIVRVCLTGGAGRGDSFENFFLRDLSDWVSMG